ncbi:alpha/beta hydrolase [Alteribacter natronophilus]|uniref:alpha/beta hydrolase n=1 Tax=Alteribacter natronophilus TaxID=2583810 RepID=UPI00110D8BD5|nr:hypothetical protein [Alteribacter natronophilus]TMW70648.1 hypothetical protein FGB90_15815 [Alteribacter natronophilus]
MRSQIQKRFADWEREAFRTFRKGDLKKSREMSEEIAGLFPEKRYKTDMWRISIHARTGEKEAAFRLAFQALHDGIWWHPERLREEPELDPLKSDARFDLLVEACYNLMKQESDRHLPMLYSMGDTQSRKRMFAIHWRGDNASAFSEYWEETALLSDWHVGFPQSSQVFGYERFCWDDEQRARADLSESKRHFDEISMSNSDQTVLCGASQGGKLAIDSALGWKPFRESRFFAVVPSIRDLKPYEAILREGICRDTRGYILTGEYDPYIDQAAAFHKLLTDYDVPCKLKIVNGIGHEFPEDFETYLLEAAEFLTGE